MLIMQDDKVEVVPIVKLGKPKHGQHAHVSLLHTEVKKVLIVLISPVIALYYCKQALYY